MEQEDGIQTAQLSCDWTREKGWTHSRDWLQRAVENDEGWDWAVVLRLAFFVFLFK